MPELSVIMQSKFLRENAEEKLIRAVNSVLGQKQKCSYELIIIADNCPDTVRTIKENFGTEIRLFEFNDDKKKTWRTQARNVGLENAQGTWVVYLDNDDYYANNYLKALCNRLDPVYDWYLVNDLVYRKPGFKVRQVNMKFGYCGTANIIHKSTMRSRWPDGVGYGREDWRFINNLYAESRRYKEMDIAGYCVAHIPKQYEI